MRPNHTESAPASNRSRNLSTDGPLPLVLFVCAQGKQRSRTAYDLCAAEKAYWPYWSFGYGGVSANPSMPLDAFDVQRAHLIVVMERKHVFQLRSRFPRCAIDETRLICIDVPDEYDYFDDELVQILRKRLHPLLKRSA